MTIQIKYSVRFDKTNSWSDFLVCGETAEELCTDLLKNINSLKNSGLNFKNIVLEKTLRFAKNTNEMPKKILLSEIKNEDLKRLFNKVENEIVFLNEKLSEKQYAINTENLKNTLANFSSFYGAFLVYENHGLQNHFEFNDSLELISDVGTLDEHYKKYKTTKKLEHLKIFNRCVEEIIEKYAENKLKI